MVGKLCLTEFVRVGDDGLVDCAEVRHAVVATVTPEVKFVVELVDLVAVMAVDRAREADAMGLHHLAQLEVPLSGVCDECDCFPCLRIQKLSLVFVACLAREHRLVHVPVGVPASLLNELCSKLQRKCTYCSEAAGL